MIRFNLPATSPRPILFGSSEPSITMESATATMLGIPFDEGSSFRFGAKDAPDWIRSATIPTNMTPFTEKGVDVSTKHSFFDGGNLDMLSTQDISVEAMIKKAIQQIAKNTSLLMVLGGDHYLTSPVLDGLNSLQNENMGLIYFDAHSDYFESLDGNPNSHASTLFQIISKKIIDPKDIIVIGERSGPPDHVQALQEMGTVVISTREFDRLPITELGKVITNQFADQQKLYVSIDLDVFDPAFAPAIGNPEPGGIFPRKFFSFLEFFTDFNIRGFDLVELIPQYDTARITSALSAKIIKELLGLIPSSVGINP